MSKIKVIVKRPDSKPYSTYISNRLENLQAIVGGWIEAATVTSDMAIICNEEGRLMGLPHNCTAYGIDFVGTIIFVGTKEDEFTDIPISFKEFLEINRDLQEGEQ